MTIASCTCVSGTDVEYTFTKLSSENGACTFQVAVAEEKTAGGLYLTDASKEKPSIGTVSYILKTLQ